MQAIGFIIIIVVIVALAALVLWILQFVYLIVGWLKIKNGGLSRNSSVAQVEDAVESDKPADYIEESVEFADSDSSDEEDFDTLTSNTSGINKKWLIWGGIAAIIVVIGVIIYLNFFRRVEVKVEPCYVKTEEATIYKLKDGFMGKEPMITLPQGTYLELLRVDDDSVWATVVYNDMRNALAYRGFVHLSELVMPEELNNEAQESYDTSSEYIQNYSDGEEEEFASYDNSSDYGYEEPEGDEYTYIYEGTINDKYAIEMTLTSDGGAYYSGEYFYTKNKTPIQLRGELTDDYEHLVLEEYVGMEMTGKFEGTLSDDGYYGTWTSADGTKSYPFKVSAK